MTPKAVIFDLGKVLVDFDYNLATNRIAARSPLEGLAVKRLLDHSPLLYEYETGLLTSEQFYSEMSKATGFEGGFDEFARAFADIFQPITPLVGLPARLRQQGTPCYIFSNTNPIAVEHIRRTFPFFSNFDGYVLSYEHGAMKPQAKLYEVVERQSGMRQGDLLYIDDRPENIAAGAARGWQVILQEQPEKTIAALERSGLLSPSSLGATRP